MNRNQNETRGQMMNDERGAMSGSDATHRPLRHSSLITHHSSLAFTLTELLVVITIIGILASLITGAVISALSRANQVSITLEIQQLDMAVQDFKNEYGAYPPNVFLGTSLTSSEQTLNGTILLRFLKKSSPRSTEFNTSVAQNTSGNNVSVIAAQGLSSAEALVFWLQGFSQDVSRPLTGTDLVLTSIDDKGTTINNVITIESFQPRYDFDRGRLRISREPDGTRRFLAVQRLTAPIEVQIQLYEYLAPNSEEPFVYFDTSRETPLQVVNNWTTTEFFYSSPTSGGSIYPLKQLRADTPVPADRASPTLQYVEYLNPKKFQILHCGLDDIWGDFSSSTGGELDLSDNNFVPTLLFPTGPFIGDIADTVGNFGDGTLEDEQE